MATIPAVIDRILRARGLVGTRLVVGVSGGPDSVALLLGLIDRRASLELELVVAHFDHGLRRDSSEDALFVQHLARRLGLSVMVDRATDLSGDAQRRAGIEALAREQRYAFFANVVQQTESRGVLVGHTADDQTETRLLHLVRGSGLAGLVGMAEDTSLRTSGGRMVRVIRPLLRCPRAATRAYCADQGIAPRHDATNDDLRFARNRLRHEIVPVLRQLNSGFDEALERLAGVAADAEELIESELARWLPEVATLSGNHWTIDRPAWRQLSRALKHALLLRAAATFGRTDAVQAANVRAAIEAIDRAPAGTSFDWSAGLTLAVDYDRATLAAGRPARLRLRPLAIGLSGDSETPLRWSHVGMDDADERANAVDEWVLHVRQRAAPCRRRQGDCWHVDLDRARLVGATSLVVRARVDGDRFAPVGMSGTKKLQDFFVDRRVPAAERDGVPIVATADGRIVWIAGHRADRRFLADSGSSDVVCLELIRAAERGAAPSVQAQR
jgi:tRNA(Ile)-lysidine synthase